MPDMEYYEFRDVRLGFSHIHAVYLVTNSSAGGEIDITCPGGALNSITRPGGVGFKSQGLAEAPRVTPEI